MTPPLWQKAAAKSLQSGLTLCDPMVCSLPSSLVHEILQVRILEWVAISFSICFTDYAKAFDCVDHNKLWKILQGMGIPDHLTCLLRNLYAAQEATVRTGHGTSCSKLGKDYSKAVYCHLVYLTYMQSTSNNILV